MGWLWSAGCWAQTEALRSARNAYLDRFAAYAAEVNQTIVDRDYRHGEAVLDTWRAALQEAAAVLDARQRLYSHARHQQATAYLKESRGLAEYFLQADFIAAPQHLAQAAVHHDNAADLLGQVHFDPGVPKAGALRDAMVRMERAEAERVRGMERLVQGDH